MKAFRIHGPNSGKYEDVPDPRTRPDEALIRVRAAGTCGTDLEIYQGSMFYFTTGLASYPVIPGHEWSGEVVEVGQNVRDMRVGDRVVGECTVPCGGCELCRSGWYNLCPNRRETGILNLDGAFAEYMAYPAAFLHRFHDRSFDEMALAETTAVAVYAVKLVEVSPSDRVAVLGAGPIGLQAAQAARARGARQVIVIGGRESRRKLACELGVDDVIDPRTQDVVEETLRLTDGRKFDVVVEATGNPEVTADLTRIVRPRGRVSLVGLFGSQKGMLDLDALVVGCITLRGSLGSPGVWDETIHLLEEGIIRAAPLITERRPLREVTDVFAMMAERRPELVKAVLVP